MPNRMLPCPVPYSEEHWRSLKPRQRWKIIHPLYFKRYDEVHKEEKRKRQREYYLTHWKGNPVRSAATLAAWRRWRDNHPEAHRAKNAKWRQSNPRAVNFMNRRREHQQKGATGSHTFQEWEALKARFHHICPGCGRCEP